MVQDLQARAWAYLGNARRIAFDLAGAEEALARAERLAESGSADPLEEARILDLRASLLSDQGHFEQAAELLDVVVDIYDDLREPHRKGRAMISKGVFLGYAGWPEEAIRQIRKGLGLADWDARAAPGADGPAQPRLVPERLRRAARRPSATSSASATPTGSSTTPGPSCASPGSPAASPPAWAASRRPRRPSRSCGGASSPRPTATTPRW